MDMPSHLVVFVISTSFLGWCVWLATSWRRGAGAPGCRVVLPYRIITAILSPLFILYTFSCKCDPVLRFVCDAIAIGCVPLAVYCWTLTIILDDEFVSMRHFFRQRRIRFSEITGVRERSWSAETVIRGQDGSKIVVPMVLRGADHIINQCRVRMRKPRP